jgi:hypothetical protein
MVQGSEIDSETPAWHLTGSGVLKSMEFSGSADDRVSINSSLPPVLSCESPESRHILPAMF